VGRKVIMVIVVAGLGFVLIKLARRSKTQVHLINQ